MINEQAAGTIEAPGTLRELIAPSGRVELAGLSVDLGAYRASYRGRPLRLSTSQLEVLALLMTNRTRVCSRQELSAALGLFGARTIDVILSELRREVGRQFIRNIHSLGWIIDPAALSD